MNIFNLQITNDIRMAILLLRVEFCHNLASQLKQCLPNSTSIMLQQLQLDLLSQIIINSQILTQKLGQR